MRARHPNQSGKTSTTCDASAIAFCASVISGAGVPVFPFGSRTQQRKIELRDVHDLRHMARRIRGLRIRSRDDMAEPSGSASGWPFITTIWLLIRSFIAPSFAQTVRRPLGLVRISLAVQKAKRPAARSVARCPKAAFGLVRCFPRNRSQQDCPCDQTRCKSAISPRPLRRPKLAQSNHH